MAAAAAATNELASNLRRLAFVLGLIVILSKLLFDTIEVVLLLSSSEPSSSIQAHECFLFKGVGGFVTLAVAVLVDALRQSPFRLKRTVSCEVG